MLALLWLIACEAIPTAPEDIDNAVATGDLAYACKGYASEVPEMRTYTAEHLRDVTAPEATACTCVAMYDPATGVFDGTIAKAVVDKKGRDELAKCLAPAVTDARVDRIAAIEALAAFKAPSAEAALTALAAAGADATNVPLRAAAVRGLRFYDNANPTLIASLAAAEPEIRAAAASALERHVDQGAIVALDALVTTDPMPEVRAAAAASLASVGTLDGDNGACKALIGDADLAVRAAPLRVWQSQQARRVEVIACLAKKLGTPEADDATVGAAIAHLKMAATPDAELALCDAIGPFVRANVTDALPEEGGPRDVISAQNALRWDLTPDCVQKAWRQGGYSCHGKYWLAWWIVRVGGHASAPACPGMTGESITSSGPRELSFE